MALTTGSDDVVNLGWKLAAKLNGWGSDALLASYSEERRPIFKETAEDFIEAGIRRDREFLRRYSPERDRTEFERAWQEHINFSAPNVLTYEPHYEGSSIVFGPPGAASSARGAHTFKARAGHHLPPQLLSSGRNVFEELGDGFTLFAFDRDETTAVAFAQAAKALHVPLKIVCDSFDQGRRAYEAKFILVRPDRYIAWTENSPRTNAVSILAKAVAKPLA
jgi:hypothetical protein